MRLLKNRAVLSVEQDGIDASMIVNGSTEKVIAKTERNGDVAVGLFNTTSKAEVISTTASAIGLPASGRYRVVEPVDAQGQPERQHDQRDRAAARRGLLPDQADPVTTLPATVVARGRAVHR